MCHLASYAALSGPQACTPPPHLCEMLLALACSMQHSLQAGACCTNQIRPFPNLHRMHRTLRTHHPRSPWHTCNSHLRGSAFTAAMVILDGAARRRGPPMPSFDSVARRRRLPAGPAGAKPTAPVAQAAATASRVTVRTMLPLDVRCFGYACEPAPITEMLLSVNGFQ